MFLFSFHHKLLQTIDWNLFSSLKSRTFLLFSSFGRPYSRKKFELTNSNSGLDRVVGIYADIDQAIEVSQLLYKFNFGELGSVLSRIAKLTEILVYFLTRGNFILRIWAYISFHRASLAGVAYYFPRMSFCDIGLATVYSHILRACWVHINLLICVFRRQPCGLFQTKWKIVWKNCFDLYSNVLNFLIDGGSGVGA